MSAVLALTPQKYFNLMFNNLTFKQVRQPIPAPTHVITTDGTAITSQIGYSTIQAIGDSLNVTPDQSYGPSLFVHPEGEDSNDGLTLRKALKTIGRAVQVAESIKQQQVYDRVTIRVSTGNYVEQAPLLVPSNVSIIGNDLRTVVVQPTENTKTKNLFLLNNKCYIWGLRLAGCAVDNLENPREGFFFAFAPNAYITTSPYVQNCTASHTPFDKFYAPLDPANENPLIGNGPGGMIVDDSVLDPYSPLKSMIVDAYTQVAFNGVGICVRGRGYAQLVSFFTNFSRVGVYCIDGGHASLLNSNTTFGDYGLRSKGIRKLVKPDVSSVPADTSTNLSQDITGSKQQILDFMIQGMIAASTIGDYSDPNSAAVILTRKDAGILIDSLASDMLTAMPARTSQFIQGLFKAQDSSQGSIYTLPTGVVTVFDPTLLPDFILSFTLINQYIADNFYASYSLAVRDKLDALVDLVIDTLESVVDQLSLDFVEDFGSLITSTAHDFSYAGSGVNFIGLPNNQGGVGETDLSLRIVEESGGRVFHTSGDESGDFFAGNDFIIRQATGTIDGRAFAKSLFALVTPFSLALEN